MPEPPTPLKPATEAESAAQESAPEPPEESEPPVPVLASADEAKPPARFPWLGLTIFSALVAMMIGRAELSRLSGDMIDITGRSWAFGELTGSLAFTVADGWSAVFATDVVGYRQGLAVPYAILGILAAVLFAVVVTGYIQTHGAGRCPRHFRMLPILAGAFWVLESVGVLIATHRPPHGFLTGGLVAAVEARWLALLITLVVFVRLLVTPDGRTARQTWRVWREGIYRHRLSIVPVAVVAVVTLTPAAEILDQVPDVVRRWADSPGNLWEAFWGILSLLIFCTALYMLGRARVKLAARDFPVPLPVAELPRPKPTFWLWGPALILVLGIVDRVLGGAVSWGRLVAFCAVPVLIWLATVLVRVVASRRPVFGNCQLLPPITLKPVGWDVLRATVVFGDVLAFALLDIAGLGAIRAFTAVVAVQAHDASVHAGRLNPYAVGLLGVGILGVLAIWPLAGFLVARLPVPLELYGPAPAVSPAAPAPGSASEAAARGATNAGSVHNQSAVDQAATSTKPGSKIAVKAKELPRQLLQPRVILAVCVAGLIIVGSAPVIVERAGVLTSFIVSLGLLTGMVAAGALVTQQRLMDDVFRLLRLRSTPMITLFFLAVIFAGLFGSSDIHAVQSQPQPVTAGTKDPRPTLAAAFDDWLADTQACRSTMTFEDKLYTVRPMIFVAAEGGGVRAAYWTVHSLVTLADQVPCAAHSTFLSSGVSGGAVGLSVLRFNAKPDEVMEQLSGSGALSVGIVGTLLRDFAYSAGGIPLPNIGDRPAFRWNDRAALMEGVWNASPAAQWKDQSFVVPLDSTVVQPATGQVILNSDALGNACRVWISQIQFPATLVGSANDVGQQGVDCDRAGTPALRSVDLISDYGPYAAASAAQPESKASLPDGCVRGLTAATAGLLAARFPYVTPSGVIGPCRLATGVTRGQDQLLDGGYLENSGLGTIVDLSPQWLDLVRAHNAKAVATGGGVLVVPTVVYLDNDTGNDRSAAKRSLTSEFLVPPTGKLRALTGLETDLSYLQRAKAVVTPEAFCGGDVVCRAAEAHLGDRRVIEVYQSSTPQVAAPLGWILSDASRDTMDKALAGQTKRVCSAPRPGSTGLVQVDDAVCKRQFGTLGDLIQMLTVADY